MLTEWYLAQENLVLSFALVRMGLEDTVYVEAVNAVTNDFGIVNTQVGADGELRFIDWAEGPYLLRTTITTEKRPDPFSLKEKERSLMHCMHLTVLKGHRVHAVFRVHQLQGSEGPRGFPRCS